MKTNLKKILFAGVLAIQVFLSLVTPNISSAAPFTGTWYNPDPFEFYLKVYDPNNPQEIFGERYTAAQVNWIFNSLTGWVLNGVVGYNAVSCFYAQDVGACIKALFKIADNGTLNQNFAVNENPIKVIFTQDRPLSGITYFRGLGQKMNIIPQANAQATGFGFTAFDPIRTMWTGMRDVAYGLLVIVVLALAFLIMFRVKLSPQTVVSIQSALPNIIITLILITFSYAIAGLLVDFMYVVIGLFSFVASRVLGGAGWQAQSWAEIFGLMTRGPAGFGIFGAQLVYLLFFFLRLIGFLLIDVGLLWTAIAGALFVTAASTGFVGMIALLLLLGVFAMITLVLIRSYVMLIRAFASLLLLVIFSPILLLAGAVVPSMGLGSWLKAMLSHLAVFVVTGMLIFFSFYFLIISFFTYAVGGIDWAVFLARFILGSSFINSFQNIVITGRGGWPPLLGWGNNGGYSVIFMGVSFILFTITPRVADMVQSFIQGRPFAFGNAIGEAVAPVTRAWQQGTDYDRARSIYMAGGGDGPLGFLSGIRIRGEYPFKGDELQRLASMLGYREK